MLVDHLQKTTKEYKNLKKQEIDDILIKKNYNPGENIWNKIENSGKTGQDKKILISTFARFLTAIAKV